MPAASVPRDPNDPSQQVRTEDEPEQQPPADATADVDDELPPPLQTDSEDGESDYGGLSFSLPTDSDDDRSDDDEHPPLLQTDSGDDPNFDELGDNDLSPNYPGPEPLFPPVPMGNTDTNQRLSELLAQAIQQLQAAGDITPSSTPWGDDP